MHYSGRHPTGPLSLLRTAQCQNAIPRKYLYCALHPRNALTSACNFFIVHAKQCTSHDIGQNHKQLAPNHTMYGARHSCCAQNVVREASQFFEQIFHIMILVLRSHCKPHLQLRYNRHFRLSLKPTALSCAKSKSGILRRKSGLNLNVLMHPYARFCVGHEIFHQCGCYKHILQISTALQYILV